MNIWNTWDWLILTFLGGVLIAVILLSLQEYFMFKPTLKKKTKRNIADWLKRNSHLR
jgi:RsiW-degrading membrane proteinase PrsW (M82 family)